jgi:CheY-like chemotaxis protein
MSRPVSQPTRTLLVDDEPLVLKILSEALQNAGHEVGTASNGEQGLAKFQETKWDVVVTDRAMPVVDGEKLAASIKLLSPQTPIILITGMASAVCDASPFAVILQKPFRACHLLNAIQGCVTKSFGLQVVAALL